MKTARKALLTMGAILFLLPLGAGCETNEPVLWSLPHNKRKANTILHGFHRLHMDFDRIFLDMEEYSVEAEY